MSEYLMLRWILLVPFFGVLFNGLLALVEGEEPAPMAQAAWVGLLTAVVPFALCCVSFWRLQTLPAETRFLNDVLAPWFASGGLEVQIALHMDALSALFALVLTGAATLVQLFSMGFLHPQDNPSRHFAHLSLLLFSALLLLLGDNLLLVFAGWQGVGIASYLLTGHWYHRYADGGVISNAGARTFLYQRIGGLSFLLGVFILFWALYPQLSSSVKAFTFPTLEQDLRLLLEAKVMGFSALEIAGACFLIAACAKCAQLPLSMWWIDATAAPLPATSLIHSAAMLSGLYLIARLHFLFSNAPHVALLMACIGACTALFAAALAVFQTDLKVLLSYLTLGQVGLVFIGFGVGAYSVGTFHLLATVFIQTLLFLAAGSVLFGTNKERDVRRMGGLFLYMKVTGFIFFLGVLAFVGFPGFSGFFSRATLLWSLLATHHPILWSVSMIAIALSCFAIMRAFGLIFMGSLRRSSQEIRRLGAPTESSPLLTLPAMVLGVFVVFFGFVGLPKSLSTWMGVNGGHLQKWLAPIFTKGWSYHPHGAIFLEQAAPHQPLLSEWGAFWLAPAFGLTGAVLAFFFYGLRGTSMLALEHRWRQGEGGWWGALVRFMQEPSALSEWLRKVIVEPIYGLAQGGLHPFDQLVLNGALQLIARTTQRLSQLTLWLQGDAARLALYGVAVGLVSFLLWWLLHVP